MDKLIEIPAEEKTGSIEPCFRCGNPTAHKLEIRQNKSIPCCFFCGWLKGDNDSGTNLVSKSGTQGKKNMGANNLRA